MKEKLVELLNGVQHYGTICTMSQMDDRYASITQVSNTEVAERLIAHGVTVQDVADNNVGCKWISVKERLPEEEDADEHDCVLAHTNSRDNYIVAREAVWKCTEFVTHWQPLHEPPKEV